MTVMADPIIQSRGTIDKFIGDAIMAYWNAPNSVENHADQAVQSALHQLSLREALDTKFNAQFGIHLDFGIGLNTGRVTVGDIGSEGRSDYTVIGDPVNLASRLEGLCKYYHVRLIISEFTYSALQSAYVVRELDIVRVKGKTEPIRIYEVLDIGTATEALQQKLDAFHEALSLYRGGMFEQAIEHFESLLRQSSDPLYSLYIQRCETLQNAGVKIFDGVYEFTEK
jgi:adenylate cyclase